MFVNSKLNNININRPSFGSIKLYDVGLKQLTGTSKHFLVPAFFSKLSFDDVPRVREIADSWRKTKYGSVIINSYLDKYVIKDDIKYFVPKRSTFYAVEQEGITPKRNKIRAMAQVIDFMNFLEVQYIQSESKIANGNKLKGAGDVMMYGIVREAKEMGKRFVFLISTADEWYKKLGFKEIEGGPITTSFELKASKFDEFLEKIGKKYNFK